MWKHPTTTMQHPEKLQLLRSELSNHERREICERKNLQNELQMNRHVETSNHHHATSRKAPTTKIRIEQPRKTRNMRKEDPAILTTDEQACGNIQPPPCNIQKSSNY